MTTAHGSDDLGSQALARRLTKLTAERAVLFGQAGSSAKLSKENRTRLAAVERELDECYHAMRRQRAQRDAERFTREDARLRPRPSFPER
jgi:hypothetical protein